MKAVDKTAGNSGDVFSTEIAGLADVKRPVVLFDTAGDARLEHRTPDRVYDLGRFAVAETPGGGGAAASFDVLRTDPELSAARRALGQAHCHIAEHAQSGMMV